MSDSEFSLIPPELVEAAKIALQKLLPAKSRKIYEAAYSRFMEWKMKKTCNSFSETVLLANLSELAQQQMPSTVWSNYSIIKNTSVKMTDPPNSSSSSSNLEASIQETVFKITTKSSTPNGNEHQIEDEVETELSTMERLNIFNRLSARSTDYENPLTHNDYDSSDLDKTNSKDSVYYHEPYEIKPKQPVMGKAALLRKNSVDSSDSSIVHSIILNKYANTLNYYVNRMFKRKSSRISSLGDETSDDNSESNRYSPINMNCVDKPADHEDYDVENNLVICAEINSVEAFDENENCDNETNCSMVANLSSKKSLNTSKEIDKKLNYLRSSDTFVDTPTKEVNNSFSSYDTVDVMSTCSDYDPRSFLVNALGEVASLSDEEIRDISSNSHKHEESVGTSHLSSLVSKSNHSSLNRCTKRKLFDTSESTSKTNTNIDSLLNRYKEELSRQHSIIFQISKALNYCKTSKEFFFGRERVEAEKILLVANVTKEALINEINMIEFDTYHSVLDLRCIGEIKLSNMCFYTIEKTDQKKSNECEEYFLVIAKCGKTVIASKVMKEDDCTVGVWGTFKFKKLQSDFEIALDVYSLVITNKDFINQGSRCPSSHAILKCRRNSKSYNFIHTETGAFNLLGKSYIRNSELAKVDASNTLHLKWFQISPQSALRPFFDLRIEFDFKLINKLTGFLTIGLDLGVITWSRRWCVLHGFVLKYWNYPSEELSEPINIVDMRYCSVYKILLAERSTCARPRTLFLPLRNSEGLKKYFLSADNQEDLTLWDTELNFVVQSLLIWKGMKNNLS